MRPKARHSRRLERWLEKQDPPDDGPTVSSPGAPGPVEGKWEGQKVALCNMTEVFGSAGGYSFRPDGTSVAMPKVTLDVIDDPTDESRVTTPKQRKEIVSWWRGVKAAKGGRWP